MKYKVGDRVRIKSIDWYNENKDDYGYVWCTEFLFTPEHSKYCGRELTISHITEFEIPSYVMESNGHDWTAEMIEGLVEEEIIDIDDFQDDNEMIDVIDEYVHRLKNNECQINLPEGYQFTDENGNVINATKIVLEKKGKEYPKTFLECCDVLNIEKLIERGVKGYKAELFDTLQKLYICRDAYWKLYGEENGLGKPWEPDWCDYTTKYCIIYSPQYRGICKRQYDGIKHILAFPTEEMRDAFYEVFREEIEICKELL